MKFTVLTLFPQILQAYFENSIMAKAVQKGIIAYALVNIRDFATDKHKTCDDSPYGGGAGQLMMTAPLGDALESVNAKKKRVIYLTPSGKPFTQSMAQKLSSEEELVFICGRYEGIDQRIIDYYVDDEVSIGDYVMSSGEVACNVMIDTIYRLIDGVISSESLTEESYSDNLLEYPQYTRPPVYKGMEVPSVLLSGNHEEIRKWRLRKRILKTFRNRPDMIMNAKVKGELSEEAEKMIEEITEQTSVKHQKNKRRRKSYSNKATEATLNQ